MPIKRLPNLHYEILLQSCEFYFSFSSCCRNSFNFLTFQLAISYFTRNCSTFKLFHCPEILSLKKPANFANPPAALLVSGKFSAASGNLVFSQNLWKNLQVTFRQSKQNFNNKKKAERLLNKNSHNDLHSINSLTRKKSLWKLRHMVCVVFGFSSGVHLIFFNVINCYFSLEIASLQPPLDRLKSWIWRKQAEARDCSAKYAENNHSSYSAEDKTKRDWRERNYMELDGWKSATWAHYRWSQSLPAIRRSLIKSLTTGYCRNFFHWP